MADKKIRDATSQLALLQSGDLVEVDRPTEDIFHKFEADDLRSQVQARDITQAGHGFAPPDAIHHNGTIWVKANATGLSALVCHAIVLSVSGSVFYMAATGLHTLTGHLVTIGQNFLSTTAGAVTTTQPGPGNTRQRVVVAIDSNTLLLTIGDPRI